MISLADPRVADAADVRLKAGLLLIVLLLSFLFGDIVRYPHMALRVDLSTLCCSTLVGVVYPLMITRHALRAFMLHAGPHDLEGRFLAVSMRQSAPCMPPDTESGFFSERSARNSRKRCAMARLLAFLRHV